MVKKLLLCAVLVVFMASMAFAEEVSPWAAKVDGGITGVYKSVTDGTFKGMAQFSILRSMWGNKIFGKFAFKNINDAVSEGVGFNGENYAVGTYIYAHDPVIAEKTKTPIAYITAGVGGAHQPGYFAKVSFDAGIGFFFPHPFGERLGNWCVELSAFNAQTEEGDYWSGTLSLGLQIGL